MKTARKSLALLLTVLMVLSVVSGAVAAGPSGDRNVDNSTFDSWDTAYDDATGTITITPVYKEQDDEPYIVYFTGNDDNTVTSNVKNGDIVEVQFRTTVSPNVVKFGGAELKPKVLYNNLARTDASDIMTISKVKVPEAEAESYGGSVENGIVLLIDSIAPNVPLPSYENNWYNSTYILQFEVKDAAKLKAAGSILVDLDLFQNDIYVYNGPDFLMDDISSGAGYKVEPRFSPAMITVVEAGEQFNVRFDATGGTPDNVTQVATNGKLTASQFPTVRREGYTFAGWYLDAVETADPVDASYTFTKNTTVYAHWTKNTGPSYALTKGTSEHGGFVLVDASNEEVDAAPEGETITVKPIPDAGYELDRITVQGPTGPVTVTNNSFTMPNGPATVTVTFKAIQYTVTVVTPTNGTLDVDKTTATVGETVTITAAPNSGFEADGPATYELTNDTEHQGPINVFENKFLMPAGDVTVRAAFRPITTDKYKGIFTGKDVTVSPKVDDKGKTTVTAEFKVSVSDNVTWLDSARLQVKAFLDDAAHTDASDLLTVDSVALKNQNDGFRTELNNGIILLYSTVSHPAKEADGTCDTLLVTFEVKDEEKLKEAEKVIVSLDLYEDDVNVQIGPDYFDDVIGKRQDNRVDAEFTDAVLTIGDNGKFNTSDHYAYVKGYEDGSFGPNRNITRAESATMIYRLLKDAERDVILTDQNDFPDVPAGIWYIKVVSSMAKGKYVNGYPDGTFKPNGNITRAEFATILSNIHGLKTGTSPFPDVAGHWGEQYIVTAYSYGWIMGYEDGSFRPDQYITRAEAVTMLNRMLNRGVDENSVNDELNYQIFSDNLSTAWYYYEVIEAANNHEYTGTRPSENWTSNTSSYVYDSKKYEEP